MPIRGATGPMGIRNVLTTEATTGEIQMILDSSGLAQRIGLATGGLGLAGKSPPPPRHRREGLVRRAGLATGDTGTGGPRSQRQMRRHLSPPDGLGRPGTDENEAIIESETLESTKQAPGP